jgi:hypothetical protein
VLTRRIALAFAAALTLASVASAKGRDWFVRAGSDGDGSMEKPFGDPWQALEKCEAGDAIHVAEGRYLGKLGVGEWTIPFDGIQFLGGYSKDWKERDPWKYRAELVHDRTSKNWPKESRINCGAKNVVIDGFVIDMKEQNEYNDTGRTPKSLSTGSTAVHCWLPVTIRNCVFLNTGAAAVHVRNGSTIENNVFLNVFGEAVKLSNLPGQNPDSKIPATIKNNTFVWSWCDRAPGKGRYSGAGIAMGGHANISQNIFAHCDNNAIYCTVNPDKSTITKNVFFMNLWSNFKMFIEGRDVVVDDKTMDLLEECGLKSCDGNETANPELALDKDWMDATSKRTSAERGKLTMDDWNKLRQAMGLPLQAEGGKPASGIAPAYPIEKVMELLAPRNAAVKAGARAKKLEAKFTGSTGGAPEKAYEKADLVAFRADPKKLDGKAVEMVVAVASVTNISSMPETYKKDDYEGVQLYDVEGKGEWISGFYKKGTTAQRVITEAMGRYRGQGKPDRLHLVRGIAHAKEGYLKAWLYIETAAVHEAKVEAKARPRGRDWFVRAGASGGNGSKDKPFKDPFQALERCEMGDTIHVAGGEYVGKLKTGAWRVDCAYIAMLGGYANDFSSRDPWKNPSLLYCPADFKGRRGGYTLEGADDHTGFVLDGFVFDKKLNNQYAQNGDLRYMESDKDEQVWLSKPECVIRNCVFVNSAGGALRVGTAQIVENCVFMNHHVKAVGVQRTFLPEVPFVFRNNTVVFAWDKRFGQGQGSNGDLLQMTTGVRAIVDNNIFEFADNHAIRLDTDAKDVELTNNAFSHNLWAEVYRTAGFIVVDNKTFGTLKDLGWKKCEGNELLTAGVPVDAKWFDVYLNRTAMVPGKVEMDDWNKLREMLGQPVIAKGGKATEGLAPAYDWKKALELWPKNEKCRAGARAQKLEVKFDGTERKEEEHEYAETTWDVAKNQGEWEKLDGKRVMLKIAIKGIDNQWFLDDVKKDEYECFLVTGPENDGGLPLRCYVKRGTRFERAVKQAKGVSTSSRPEETHVLKGIARTKKQMVVEVVEKAD